MSKRTWAWAVGLSILLWAGIGASVFAAIDPDLEPFFDEIMGKLENVGHCETCTRPTVSPGALKVCTHVVHDLTVLQALLDAHPSTMAGKVVCIAKDYDKLPNGEGGVVFFRRAYPHDNQLWIQPEHAEDEPVDIGLIDIVGGSNFTVMGLKVSGWALIEYGGGIRFLVAGY